MAFALGSPFEKCCAPGARVVTLLAPIWRGLNAMLSNRPSGSREGPAILLYHRIAREEFDPWSLAVSPANFEEQMKWLTDYRTVLSLTEFARQHREDSLGSDAVAITFDDGYACNALVAAPILHKLNIPATIFLPTEIIEQGRQFWWDELQRIVVEHPSDETRLDGEAITLGPKQPLDGHWAPGAPPRTERQRVFLKIWDRLRIKTSEGLVSALRELRDGAEDIGGHPLKRPLTIEEIGSVSRSIEFGSHAQTHRSLPALSKADKAREVADSKHWCETITGRPALCFAYPFGDADAETAKLVRNVGFECACITGERSVTPGSNVYTLPRIGVGNLGADGLARLLGPA
jgi:peptidoglycan/xylan/chitin deacetylase (PgdA/CDA1 family)